ncbi:MAG TPA: hypothetical protein ENG76_03515, partial [Nitrospirae bacterium]|nr:hypothetical protein [Nitrospirota bacterium]
MRKRLYETICLICLIVIACAFFARNADAELVERIVAVVNDEAILLSEFKTALRLVKESGKEVNEKE